MRARANIWSAILAAVVLVVLACMYLIYSCAGQSSASNDSERSEDGVRARAERDAAEGKTVVTLERASSFGLKGWQAAEQKDPTKDHSDLSLPGILSAAESLVGTRSDLHFIKTEGHGSGLSGVIDPRDRDAVAVSLLLEPVRVRGLGDAPPTAELRSLAEAAAAAVEIVSVEPSASGIVGPRAAEYPEQCRAIEAAGRAWPQSARVGRVMAAPANEVSSPSRLSVNCRPGDEPRASIERLRSAGVLTLDSANHRWVTAVASILYQNPAGGDRELHVKFVLDTATEQWVLTEIISLPSKAEAMRWVATQNSSELHANTHTLDVTSVLRDQVVTSNGLVPRKR